MANYFPSLTNEELTAICYSHNIDFKNYVSQLESVGIRKDSIKLQHLKIVLLKIINSISKDFTILIIVIVKVKAKIEKLKSKRKYGKKKISSEVISNLLLVQAVYFSALLDITFPESLLPISQSLSIWVEEVLG